MISEYICLDIRVALDHDDPMFLDGYALCRTPVPDEKT
jgi:hypothetical protein